MEDLNRPYKIAVCDSSFHDGNNVRGIVAGIMSDLGVDAIVELFTSTHDLVAKIREHERFSMFLLETDIARESGIHLAGQLRSEGIDEPIIFVSSTADRALDGYKVRADDYLLKPVPKDFLQESILRVMRARKTALFKTSDGIIVPIEVGKIAWAEAFVHKTDIHTGNGIYTVRSILSDVISSINDSRFIRCHRSYLVNIDYVEGISRKGVKMRDGTDVPLSRGGLPVMQGALEKRVDVMRRSSFL